MTTMLSREAKGDSSHCPLRQADAAAEVSRSGNDAACPKCGAGLKRSAMLLSRLRALATKHPELEQEEITGSSPWPLGGDSLTSVELMLELEKEIGISISPREADRIMTVGQAIRYFIERTRGLGAT
jgi:acyl carrier protein